MRAFYSEAQELTEFLSKISCANDTLRSMQSNVEDEEIDELSRNQWSQACDFTELTFSCQNYFIFLTNQY